MAAKKTTYKTPGVYIEEVSAFPNAIAAVETAIPAFIGYTEKAVKNGKSLHEKPTRINSLMEFEGFYGEGSKTKYALAEVKNPSETPVNYDVKLLKKAYSLDAEVNTRFNLYESMKFFYQNGGAACYIVSVGTYEKGVVTPEFSETPFLKGIKALEKETEPSILVIPDAMLLEANNCYALQQQMLDHCGKMMNRVAILDIHSGDKELDDARFNPVDNFRNQVSSNHLSYGAAYYPWLHTTIVQASDISYKNLNEKSLSILKEICETSEAHTEAINPYLNQLTSTTASSDPNINPESIHKTLNSAIPDYKRIMEAILKKKNLLPPSAAMAGIYTETDNSRGVWKAPANVGLSSVISPSVIINDFQQKDLNVPLTGKAICAIRSFAGRGTLVWGARTLDANSLDWRYINVRRTIIMIEQSIKLAAKAYVFEPNTSNTWISVKAMIENFLSNVWRQGGLAGAKSDQAFFVAVGLGSTMTATDIQEGIMRIQMGVALSHPAEFIVISFEQQMQQS